MSSDLHRTRRHCNRPSFQARSVRSQRKHNLSLFPQNYVTSQHEPLHHLSGGDNNSCRDKGAKLMHSYSRATMCLCVHSGAIMPFDLIQGHSSLGLNGDFTRSPVPGKKAAAGWLWLCNHGVFASWLRLRRGRCGPTITESKRPIKH